MFEQWESLIFLLLLLQIANLNSLFFFLSDQMSFARKLKKKTAFRPPPSPSTVETGEERANPFPPRSPGATVGSPPLLRSLRRRKGGGTPDLGVWDVNRAWESVAGGGACGGAARSRTAFVSSRSALPLVGALCCGDGSVMFPPRDHLGDSDGRVLWGSSPWA